MQFWRSLKPADIDAMVAIAAIVHPGFPEDRDVLAERLALSPRTCFLAERDGAVLGYCLAHPFSLGKIPPLNRKLGALPARPDTFYIHDLSLLPQAQGMGLARAIVSRLTALASPLSTMSLVAVNNSEPFWQAMGFESRNQPELAAKLASYGLGARYMVRPGTLLP